MTTIVLSFLVTLIGALVCAEAKAWTPRLIAKVLGAAVKNTPPSLRERMREEWQAHIDETPGSIARIAAAIGFLLASRNLIERAPFIDRVQTTSLAVRVSVRLIGAHVARCMTRRARFSELRMTIELVGRIWQLLGPSLNGSRSKSYAFNILESVVIVLETVGKHEGSRDELQQKLRRLSINPETGSISPHPSSAPR